MLGELLEAYGYSIRQAAEKSGVSATSIARYIQGDRPSLTTAGNLTGLFNFQDARALFAGWGYDRRAEQLERERTHDPNVANGWRLETLIAEQRKTNQLLARLVHFLEPTYPMPEKESNVADSE